MSCFKALLKLCLLLLAASIGAEGNVAIKNKEENPVCIPNNLKREPRRVASFPTHDLQELENQYVYVQFNKNLDKWTQGLELIGNISNLLQVDLEAFTHGRVSRNEVTFKVQQNRRGLNATEVAECIDLIKDRFKEITDFEVMSVGIGNQKETQIVESPKSIPSIQLKSGPNYHCHLVIFCCIWLQRLQFDL